MMWGWNGYGPGYGGFGYGWIGMLVNLAITVVLLVGIVLLVVWVVRRLSANGQSIRPAGLPETPQEILKARYARGEITREQFLEMSKELQ